VNDFLAVSTEQFFFSGLCVNGRIFSFWFADMNIFIEKKTNIGFYNLKDPLGVKFFLHTENFFAIDLLIPM
jgi:hypothetical protein